MKITPNARPVSASRTEQAQIVLSSHINGNKRLFGGQLLVWIDTVAAVVARRHAQKEVTTVAIDNLHFHEGVKTGSTVILYGCVTCTGRTSMEIRVDTYRELLTGERTLVNRAYLVMVAIDEDGRPTPVPKVIPETPEEREEFEKGQRRQELRKSRRSEGY